MRSRSKFRSGSGCFICGCCGRRTRDVDGNGDLELCPECYDLGGIENEISDCGSTPAREKEAQKLRELIVQKGGKLPS